MKKIKKIIDTAGGNLEVAYRLQVDITTIWRWIKAGEIPRKYHKAFEEKFGIIIK